MSDFDEFWEDILMSYPGHVEKLRQDKIDAWQKELDSHFICKDDDDYEGDCQGCMCPSGRPPCHHCVEHWKEGH